MAEPTSDSSINIRSLILVPAVITLGITLLRLVGELEHWSPRLFSPAPGGGMAVIGISWLPILLGPYFAVKLAHSGDGHFSVWKTFGLSVLGLAIMIAGGLVGFGPKLHFPGRAIVGLVLIAVAPLLVNSSWPALFRVLVAYGYAARIPVAILMAFAIHGHWGTHYDVVPPNYAGPEAFFGKYMLIAFLPQMVVWIAFTVLVGALFGSLVTAVMVRDKPVAVTP